MVQPSNQAKFLGVTFYLLPELGALCWEPHVQGQAGNLYDQTFKGETWVTLRSLVHPTYALVRSRLTYGHEAFITTTDTLWMDL